MVEFSGNCYLITCRHVVTEAGTGFLFGLSRPRKTKNPPGGYKVLTLGQPTFHPLDSDQHTFDLAVLPILDVNMNSLAAEEIVPVDLRIKRDTAEFVLDSQRVYACGYPIAYVEPLLSENVNDALPPKKISGITRSISIRYCRKTDSMLR